MQTGYVFAASETQTTNSAAAAAAVTNGLVGWWTGNGNALDTTGNDPGTASGGVSYTTGVNGQAFQFSGASGGEVSIPDSTSLDSSSFSIGGWFELTQAPPAGGEVYLASKYGGNYNGWILRLNSSMTLTLSLLKSATANTNVSSSQPLALNKWYFISATYDGFTASIYVNGVLTGSTILAGGYAASPTPLVLGAASWYSGGFTTGLIDDFTFYDRALSADEVASLADNAGGMPLVDQRGFSRVAGGTPDIGSYQVQPYIVTNTNDSGRGSLRQAVLDDVSGDEPIEFASSLSGHTITLLSPIVINHNLTITGPGASVLTISGGGATEIFQVESGTVAISGVTLASGVAPQGGAISNSGTLSISADIFSGDVAQGTTASPGALGGAIFNAAGGVLSVVNSTFDNDSAIAAAGGTAAGGAIENQGGSITLTSDTFTANLAEGGTSGSGGAIDNASTFNPDGSVSQTGSATIVNVDNLGQHPARRGR